MIGALLTAVLILACSWLLERWRSREQWKKGNWITLPLWWLPAMAFASLVLIASGFWFGGRYSDAGKVVFYADTSLACGATELQRLNRELVQWMNPYKVRRDTTTEVETP